MSATPLADRLFRAASHESVTALLPGYIHDLNNALVGIQSHADLCVMKLEPDHPLLENLGYLRRSTTKAVELVASLNQLLENRSPGRQWHDLRQLGQETLELARPGLFRGMELESHWGSVPLPVEVDGMAFRQAMIQLIRNAMMAIGQKGTIRVQTFRLERLPEGLTFWGQPREGPLACLAVTDTGRGMADETLQRVFDGMSWLGSEKPAGPVGMGLPTVCRFVRDHAGSVSAESVLERGSSFKIWLPLLDVEGGTT